MVNSGTITVEVIFVISEKTYYELLLFKEGPIALDGQLTRRMKDIIEAGYIEPNKETPDQIGNSEWVSRVSEWRLSDREIDALSEFENDRQQKAKNAHDKRTDRNIAIAALVVAVITLASTLFDWHIG